MCGICGVVYSDAAKVVSREMLVRMTNTMIHRGPDSDGFYVTPGIGFGIRRLSIIDLEAGDQPISNEDGTVTVVCNGEIYNFIELRKQLESKGHRFRTHSDVEVIVHLYEEHGVECILHLRGMFGLAIWDQPRRRLLLARDRLGIKPLFYALHNDALFFGSELKSILMSDTVDRQLDVHALKDLFVSGFVLGPKTLFQNIRRLMPGHTLVYQQGSFSIQRYWEPRFPAKGEFRFQRSPEEWAERLREKMKESVRLHLRSDVPLGAFLSSGIDSSSVVSLMAQSYDHPIRTFSLAFENPKFDEVSNQKILSDFPDYHLLDHRAICETRHIELLKKSVWHREDPTSIVIDIPLMIVSHLSSQFVKVILCGEGSDEVFGGYQWFRTHKMLGPYMKLPLRMRQSIAGLPVISRNQRKTRILAATPEMNLVRYTQLMHTGNPGFEERLFSNEIRERLENDAPTDMPAPPAEFKDWHSFNQLQYFEMTVRLPDLIIRNLDSASMAHSLEARVPFLDHEVVEFCAEIPPYLKMRGLQEKHILRRAMKRDVPSEILRRRKRGLVPPLSQWIANLPDFATELLTEKAIRQKRYFNSEVVTGMLQSFRRGNTIYDKSLMCVVGVQLWDDLFLQNLGRQ